MSMSGRLGGTWMITSAVGGLLLQWALALEKGNPGRLTTELRRNGMFWDSDG
ncbi:hypothetical protein BDZ94DRAFT_1268786 [Collybia nuda]|uniref:Uncharacterized protein n=1 Tax=Collybia nuda TaxID=64659 RepID=A0A9P5Y118_9AGAR|nr:hypothetical protein BDZ94DRAFT_1268786 [Collybia nuda]